MLTYVLLESDGQRLVGVLHNLDELGWIPWVLEHWGISHSDSYGRTLPGKEARDAYRERAEGPHHAPAKLTDFLDRTDGDLELEVGQITPWGYCLRFDFEAVKIGSPVRAVA